MKSDPIDPYLSFFLALHSPALICDAELTVLAANPAFEGLCGRAGLGGQPLKELLAVRPEQLPEDGKSAHLELSVNGAPLACTVLRRGPTVSFLARRLSELPPPTEHAGLDQTLLEIGRKVAGATSEEELVAVVAQGVKRLFPGRTFCIRIADQRTSHLTSLYAEGKLLDGARDLLAIKKSAARKIQLDVERLPKDRVRLVDGEVPLMFEGSGRGISAPLIASGQLFGVINVEYPPEEAADLAGADRVLTQLVNQVAVGIRNAKLIDELTFVRKYLEELLEHANALILVANRDRKVVVFNRLLAQLSGLRREEVLGQDLLELVPEAERIRVVRVIANSLRGEAVSNFETRILGVQGKEVRVSFATSSLLRADGEVEGVIAIGQDLTVVRELERRVIHAEKLATLGKFAASVVHEINNPMTAVASYAHALLARSMMQPGADPADTQKLKKIIENADRILKFTRDLVSYARPAQDRTEQLDVHPVLDMAVSFCDHVLSEHAVVVDRRYGPVARIAGVRGNLVQVFVNLITNACHATKGGGSVRLETSQEDQEVVIRVCDQGIGIDAEHLGHIFEPFYTTKPDGKGTGLGLSIVQGIVESHGGEIDVESAMGQGTRFIIRLPRAE
jgi:two-component system, NtrC family, sensor kinase